MGKVLQRAVAEVAKLPETEQEAVSAWILAELESERRWNDLSPDPPIFSPRWLRMRSARTRTD